MSECFEREGGKNTTKEVEMEVKKSFVDRIRLKRKYIHTYSNKMKKV